MELYDELIIPFGNVVVVIVKTAGLIVIEKTSVSVTETESVTLTVKLLVPAELGVPLIIPVDGAMLNPTGKVPVILHVYGDVPPVADNVTGVYDVPIIPFDKVLDDITSVAGFMVIENISVSVAEIESVAKTVNVRVCAVVGIPDITPEELIVKLVGNEPLLKLHVYGDVPPVADNVTGVYDVPIIPFDKVLDDITSVAGFMVIENISVSVAKIESVAKTVNVFIPADVGVPLIIPVDGVRLNPTGKMPVILHVYGDVPPPAINVVV